MKTYHIEAALVTCPGRRSSLHHLVEPKICSFLKISSHSGTYLKPSFAQMKEVEVKDKIASSLCLLKTLGITFIMGKRVPMYYLVMDIPGENIKYELERVNLRPKLTQAQHSNPTQVCSQTLRQDAPQNCAENVRASCFCYHWLMMEFCCQQLMSKINNLGT